MLQTWKFAVDANPKAKIIFDLYAGGFLHASSVGFIPTEFDKQKDGSTDYYTIKQAELLEVSAVSVPANAAATLAKSIGIDTDELKGAIKVLDDDDETEDEIETPEDDKTETVETPEEEDTETEPEETEVETPEEEDETVEPDPEEQEPEIPEEKKVKAPSRKSLYAKAIHKLNDRQETDLKIARDTIEKMLKGESTEVKRDFNSIIRRLLKAKK
jgi:hypothetical protein